VDKTGNWRTSSYPGADGGECVEVASTPGTVTARDTKDRNGPALNVPAKAWRMFITTMR
jgi:hypothetical protein